MDISKDTKNIGIGECLFLAGSIYGTPKTSTTFEVGEYLKKNPATELKLKEVQQLRNDVLWLKYDVTATVW